MNHHLVWNFEFTPLQSISSINIGQVQDDLKWEARFFWPEHQRIILSCIDSSLLDLGNYKKKSRDDYYYLLPNSNQNIKFRGNKLLYKPLLMQTHKAFGFGPKIQLEHLNSHSEPKEDSLPLNALLHEIKTNSTLVHVKKKAYIQKLTTNPSIKLELAQLKVHHQKFYSACIEGRSLKLVEIFSEHLLGDQISCDYVTFLKSIMQP